MHHEADKKSRLKNPMNIYQRISTFYEPRDPPAPRHSGKPLTTDNSARSDRLRRKGMERMKKK